MDEVQITIFKFQPFKSTLIMNSTTDHQKQSGFYSLL